MPNRILATYCIITLTFFGCTDSDQEPPSESVPPNIVVFLADDQGWGDLSSSGNTNLNTPHIDRIATNGASFPHFYVSPVCSPTRAEFLTGRYHPRTGVYATSAGGERMDLDETTIAEVFQQAGYSTGAFGKWHNGMQPPYHPNARGFDEFYGFCSGHWGNYFSPMLEHNGALVQGEGFVVDDFTDKAISFIESHQDSPFFVYLPYNTPHSPMQVPERWWSKFENNDLPMRHRDPEPEDLLHSQAALAMVENIDWNVGRVLQALEDLELEENTIVIYFTDNGPNGRRWNGGMKGRKGSTDEGGVRSPFYIQWPGTIEPGITIEPIASSIDLLPTLVDLADIPLQSSKPLDGVSLEPLLKKSSQRWPERFIFSHWRGRVSVRTQQYRLDYENKLYDMVADPGQYEDISVEQRDITDSLVTAKEEWERSVLTELTREKRPFTLGDPAFTYTQLPARDAAVTGEIERSNRYPNDSFYRNWTQKDETISWDVDVLADGTFEVILYYACPEGDEGASFDLTFGSSTLSAKIEEAHDVPLLGMENDRHERQESYVKEFRPLSLGTISLEKGSGPLTLQPTNIPGAQVMEFRLLLFKRV